MNRPSDPGGTTSELALAQRDAAEAREALRAAADLHDSLELSDVVDVTAAIATRLTGRPSVVWLMDSGRARSVSRAGGAMVSLGEERPIPHEVAERMRAMAAEYESTGRIVGGGPAGWSGPNRLVVPLTIAGELLGFIAAGPWDVGVPQDADLRKLYGIAPHAASAIRNARRLADMLRLSLTDALVQLPNRRQLDFFLEKEFNAAERGRPLCFVIFDLDHFKQYNDTQGHRAGDLALIQFADVLRGETRAMNLAARYGGEEFAAVLSSTTITGGKAYAERVRHRVEAEFDGLLTVSAGVVEYSDRYATVADLVVAADRALYRAKQAGRNRVYVADA